MTLKELFSRYAKGKASKKEKEIVDKWFSEIQRISARKPDSTKMRQAKEEAWEELYNRQLRQPGKPEELHKPVFRPWLAYGSVAAAIILLFVIGIPVVKKVGQAQAGKGFFTAEAVITDQFSTGRGVETITLPDGTMVSLNAGTTLSLREGKFNGKTREVWLDEGEAFFEVTKDPDRPFIVHTADGINTKVLGTSFNIKVYKELNEQVVTVKTGRVEVSKGTGEGVILDPDGNATFDAVSGNLKAGYSNGTAASGWRTGRIVLMNAGINELALRVRQVFGYEVAIQNNVINDTDRISTSFNGDLTPEELAQAVAITFNVNFRVENNRILFY